MPNKTSLQAGFQAREIRLRTLKGQAQPGWGPCVWELSSGRGTGGYICNGRGSRNMTPQESALLLLHDWHSCF